MMKRKVTADYKKQIDDQNERLQELEFQNIKLSHYNRFWKYAVAFGK